MSAPILVAYATRYGSTQEVSEAVAATLRQRGLEAEVLPMREVPSLASYRAVVLGAPIYMGTWHKDAHRFLLQHRQAFTARPVAVFALGPIHNDEEERQGAREQLDKELAKYPWLTPIALEVFAGRYDPSRLSFFHRLLAALPASPLHALPASDARDWVAIRAWASDLAVKLQPASR